MEIKVIEEKDNPILERREVRFKVEHDGPTPSRKSIVEKIAATMNSKPGLVIVDRMKSEFGKRETIGYAKIYETEARVRQVERSHIVDRNVVTAPEPEKAVPEEEAPEEAAEEASEGETATEEDEEAS